MMKAFLAVLPFLLACGPSRPAGKPTAPITLEARLEGGAVVARAVSSLPADVELEVVGLRSAKGRAPELRVPASGPILVRATVEHGGARFTRIVELGAPTPPPPRGTLRTNPRGEPILEFGP